MWILWCLFQFLSNLPFCKCYGYNEITDSNSRSFSPNLRLHESAYLYSYLPRYIRTNNKQFQGASMRQSYPQEYWYAPRISLENKLYRTPLVEQYMYRPMTNEESMIRDNDWFNSFKYDRHIANAWSKRTSEKKKKFKGNWKSLDTRKLPDWYDNAKFGIFVHWGVYSVPAYNTEWLWWHWKGDKPNGKVVSYMEDNFPGLSYQDLASKLTGKYFDAEDMAQIVEDSGAKYFVFTSKHHEGFTHWKSDESWNWNSVDLGPKRDIIEELQQAFATRDQIKFGLYFSLYEWFNPWYVKDKENDFKSQEFVKKKVTPQILELVNKYKPYYIWSDGDWEAHSDYWNSTNFLAWLYNESPVREQVVVNDRWGKDATCKHGDVKTCKDRYKPGKKVPFKWENAMTIDKKCWGYRKEAELDDFYTTAELIKILIETVSYGGNLLMNVGPNADGRIIPIFQDRMRGVGRWLKINGEAIYGTRQWRTQQAISSNGHKKRPIWYTRKDDVIYAMTTVWPSSEYLNLREPEAQPGTTIKLLGYDKNIMWETVPNGGVKINIANIRLGKLNQEHAWTFKLQNIE